MDINGCVITELIVEPVLGTGLEDAMSSALVYAIAHDLNITVMHKGKTFQIQPRKIVREIFEQQRRDE